MPVSSKLHAFLVKVNDAIQKQKDVGAVLTPDSARAALAGLGAFLQTTTPLPLETKRTYVSAGHAINVAVYSPSPEQKRPVCVWFHGGGHMCGDIDLYAPIARRLARAANMIVVTPNYRKTPEYPYPAGLTDARNCLVCLEDILTGILHSQTLYTGGDSAGGALSASLFMDKTCLPQNAVDRQILIYPSLDYTLSGASVRTNAAGYLLETDRIAWYFDHYFQNNEDRKKASPLFGDFTTHMPETLIVAAEYDPLLSEAQAYYAKIKEKVTARYHEMPGLIHAYLFLETILPEETAQTYQWIASFLNHP